MELLVLALAMPSLLVLALSVAFRRQPQPAAAPSVTFEAAPAAPGARPRVTPLSAPVAGLLQDVLPYFLVLVGVGLAVVLFNRVRDSVEVLQLLLLSRYSILTAVLLVGLVPLGLVVVRSLLGGLFVLRSPWQLFNITWLAVLIAASVLVTIRVTEHNSPLRYGLRPLQPLDMSWGPLQWITLLLLGLPVPLTCLVSSLVGGATPTPAGAWARWVFVGILLGVGMAVLLLVGAAVLEDVIIAEEVQLPGLLPFAAELKPHLPHWDGLNGLGDGLAWLAHWLDPRGQGLVFDANAGHEGGPRWRFQPGHLQAFTGMTLVFLFYLGSYFVVTWTGMVPSKNFTFTSLFYLLLLLVLLGFILQGLAFWLDLYHVPVSLAVVGFSFLLYQVNRTDHFFSLKPRRPAAAPPAPAVPPTLDDAMRAWRLPRESRGVGAPREAPKDRKTLVVVTASGGGIQAAAWATRVLVGLHDRYKEPFTRSIGLISAVSGGSVGVMYYLDRWDGTPGNPVFAPEAVAFGPDGHPAHGSICDRAMAPSLEAAAWGLVFPDLLRVFFPPALVFNRTDDRGARIEDAWKTHLETPDRRLPDWAARIRAGTLPVPVFNATMIETGQRFLSSPLVAFPRGAAAPGPVAARELLELYPGADIRVSTAVRLSASFPFVSPICRPLAGECPEQVAYHFADGGYIDNEGMVTVIDWLSRVVTSGQPAAGNQGAPFDQIALVRLMPFPRQMAPKEAARGKGWFYTVLGPIDGLMNVRVASQAERNDLAVKLFTETALKHGVPVTSAEFTFELASGASPPLSWMLTEAQKADIETAWGRVLGRQLQPDPLAVLDALFG
jgi:hypothetical protein